MAPNQTKATAKSSVAEADGYQQQQQQHRGIQRGGGPKERWCIKVGRVTWVLLVVLVLVSLVRVVQRDISNTAVYSNTRRGQHQMVETTSSSSNQSMVVEKSSSTAASQLETESNKTSHPRDKGVQVVVATESDNNNNNNNSSSTVFSAHYDQDPREIVKKMPFKKKKVAYVTFGSFRLGQSRFQSMVIDALRTWLKDDVIFYVLNEEWKTSFEEACEDPANRKECKRVIPIYVDCPEGYYGKSPCCKMDKGMTAMWENYNHYEWYSYQDDDMYIRTAYMDDFLSGLSPNDPMVLTCKEARRLGVSWGHKDGLSNCSSDTDFLFPWGQPAIYSREGFKRMSKAFQMGAIAKQCQAFGITHDTGNSIVHWMMGLPEARLPDIPVRSTRVKKNDMGTHAVGRIGVPNATEIHAQIGHVKHPEPPYEYKWHRPNGFLYTDTYYLHGNVSEWTEWHTLPVSDCRRPSHPLGGPRLPDRNFDVCVVGAGLSGAVLAERYASQLDKKVLVLEQRDHIGGNCYDFIDKEVGLRVSKYGTHIFHTKHERVWKYVQQFAEWTPYEHKVIGLVNKKHVPIPVNIETVNNLFDLNIKNEMQMDAWLKKEQVHYDHEPRNAEEVALSRVGHRLYNLIFKPYTIKQWGQEPKDLGPEVTAHISVRNNTDGRYFGDPWQALPKDGYTALFESMFRHKNIEVHTNVNYFSVRTSLKCSQTFYTGLIDTYFANLGWEKLQYRSLEFQRKVQKNVTYFQPAFVVNHPYTKADFTRIVEYKHLPNQPKSNHTVYFVERPREDGEPYYLVPNKRNKDLYTKYQAMALEERNVTFTGRLANFKYFNMDEAILNALELFDTKTL